MHHQDRNRDLLQVFGEVGLGECDDAVIVRLGSPHHALTPPIRNYGLGWLRAGAVVTVKRPRGKIVIEIGSAGRDLRLQVVEHLFRQAIWIGGSFDHQRRNGTENGSFCDPALAMATEIAHDLTTARRMADVNRVLSSIPAILASRSASSSPRTVDRTAAHRTLDLATPAAASCAPGTLSRAIRMRNPCSQA